MTTSRTTALCFVLDQSGSMESIKSDTIGGFNAYLGGLRDPAYGAVEFSLVLFDSNAIDKRHVAAPISDVRDLTNETYQPGAATPLIDAAYKAIVAHRDAIGTRDVNKLVVIQTDGHENSSTQYTFKDLSALIKDLSAAGWSFVFLGAGIDAFDAGLKMGVAPSTIASYARSKSHETFSILGAKAQAFRASGNTADNNFNAGDRHLMAEDSDPNKIVQGMQEAVQHARTLRPNYGKMVEDFDLKKPS